MAKTFISYRRADNAAFAGRIYDRLVARFGRKNIFKDVDDIPPGVNFADYIQSALRECAVVLAIIGPHWLDAGDAEGKRRLDDPADYVRIELETALDLGLTLIPVLIDHASMPLASELPKSLARLAQINALELRNDPDFTRDAERLIAGIERGYAAQRQASRHASRPSTSQAHSSAPSIPSAPSPTAGVSKPSISGPDGNQAHDESPRHRARSPFLSRLPGLFRNNRGAIVGALATVVVVISLGVALSSRSFFVGGSPSATSTSGTGDATASATIGAQNTTTTDMSSTPSSTTVRPSATATHRAITYPYGAPAPGPVCDPGNPAWVVGNDAAGITCVGGRTHMDGQPCCNQFAQFNWEVANGPTLPASHTVTIHSTNLSQNADVTMSLDRTGNYTYYTAVDSTGHWNAMRCTGSGSSTNCSDAPSGSLTSWSGTLTLAYSVTPSQVTCTANGQQLYTRSEQGSNATYRILISVAQAVGGAGEPTADLYDFSIS